MSLRDLMKKGDDAAAAEIVKKPDSGPKRPVTSPGATALMAPTIDALKVRATKAEGRAAELEAMITELKASGGSEREIDVSLIEPNPWQPRRIFDEKAIQDLAVSIGEVGLIQPIIVRSVGNPNTVAENSEARPVTQESVGIPNTFQLVSGERRLRAHRVLGITKIKAIVADVSDAKMAQMALAENIARKDLTAYEISLSIRAVQSQFKTATRLAEAIGENRSELYKYLAFADLPDFIINTLDKKAALLGRDAAHEVKGQIKKYGQAAVDELRKLWPRVIAGDLDQGKIAASIEAFITRGERVREQRDIRKLFVGSEQAGSITRDTSTFTVKLKKAAITPEKEERLRTFVEELLRG